MGATSAALAIQTDLNAKAEEASADRRLWFRIGLHLGDVVEKPDGSIYGDGVNIAARLQTIAKPALLLHRNPSVWRFEERCAPLSNL